MDDSEGPTSAATDVFVTSRDGAAIHCRRSGQGPGLILLHGAMRTANSFSELTRGLSVDFTVFAIDRRGRRPSAPAGDGYCLQKEVDDLDAVLAKTGAAFVFGQSSGALVTLKAALDGASVAKIALYEPPLAIAGARPSPLDFAPAYERALAAGDLAKALVAGFKGADDPSWFMSLPSFILAPLFRLMLAREKPDEGDAPSLAELVPTVRQDCAVVREMAGALEPCRWLETPVLLLGGTRSQPYLTRALDALEKVLPRVDRVRLKGVGHSAASDDGAPDRVVPALRAYFLA